MLSQLIVVHSASSLGREKRKLYQLASLMPIALIIRNCVRNKGYQALSDFIGIAVPHITDWKYLNLNYKTIANINPDACIGCGRCYAACEDTSHQAIQPSIYNNQKIYSIIEEKCVGCNLCEMVCPEHDCITMIAQENKKPYLNWTQHPNNPMCEKKIEKVTA